MGKTCHPESIAQALRQRHLGSAKNKSGQQATLLGPCRFDETLSNGSTRIRQRSPVLPYHSDVIAAQTRPTASASQTLINGREKWMGRRFWTLQFTFSLDPGACQQRSCAGVERQLSSPSTDPTIETADLQQGLTATVLNSSIRANSTNQLNTGDPLTCGYQQAWIAGQWLRNGPGSATSTDQAKHQNEGSHGLSWPAKGSAPEKESTDQKNNKAQPLR